MEWFRWYGGTFGDPKLQWVARQSGHNVASVLAVWVAVLERAHNHEQRGCCEGLDFESMDVVLGLDDGACTNIYSAMVRKGMIATDNMVTSWDKRQPKREDDGAAERQRVKRDKDKMISKIAQLEKQLNDTTSQQSLDVTQCHAMSRQVTTEESRLEEKREDKTLKPKSSSPVDKVATSPALSTDHEAVMTTKLFSIFEFKTAYHQATGELMPGGLNNEANALCLRHPRDRLESAFEQMAKHGGKTFRYLEEILSGKQKPSQSSRGSGRENEVERILVANAAACREFCAEGMP